MSILMQMIVAATHLIFMTAHKAEFFSYIVLFHSYNCMTSVITGGKKEDKKKYSICPRIQ